eukprot:gene5626-8580_t
MGDDAGKSRESLSLFFILLVAIATLGGGLFGYDTGIVSGAMLQIKSDKREYPDIGGFNLSSFLQEAVVSITTIGAAAGSILCGYLNNSFGRRFVNLLSAAVFIGSCMLMALAPDTYWLLAGRFIVGIAVGMAATTVPMYIAETAPSDKRGSLITMNNVCIVGGQVLASLVACALGSCKTHEGWRYMLAGGAVPAVVMLVGFLFLPESPRWLVSKGRIADARSCLEKIRPAAPPAEHEREIDEIAAAVAAEQASGVGFLQLLRDPPVVRALKLGCGLQLLQQITGINTIMYYSATILQSSDDSGDLSPWDVKNVRSTCLSAAVAFGQMSGCIVGMFLIDKHGRKTLILRSLAGVVVSLVLLGGVFVHKFAFTEILATIAMIVYLFSFGTGMSAIPWVFNAEVYPLYARSRCIAAATCVNWVSSFIISATFLTLAEAISTDRANAKDHPDSAFWLYALFGVIGYVLLDKYMPETKGLSLEEITSIFQDEGYAHVPSASSEDARVN